MRGQIKKMYYDLIKKQCELKKRVINNVLSIATICAEEFGYLIMQEPGFLGVVTGEVIYLIKCTQVDLKLQPTPNVCYEQLPVTHSNDPYFLSPRTRNIFRKGNTIHCDHRLPPMYKLDSV